MPAEPIEVFVSYAREDLPRVQPLLRALELQGWSVWWDGRIPVGEDFRSEIEAAIRRCACVVVVWSLRSRESVWVVSEAALGRKRGLIPIRIDQASPPIDFQGLQTADLSDWDGTATEPLVPIFGAIRRLVQNSSISERSEADPNHEPLDEASVQLKKIRLELLTAKNEHELRALVYRLEAFLGNHPGHVEGRMLLSDARRAHLQRNVPSSRVEHVRTSDSATLLRLARIVLLLVLAGVALLFAWNPFAGTGETPREAYARVLGASDAIEVDWKADDPLSRGARGSIVWSDKQQEGCALIEGLPPNDPAHGQYQLWVLSADDDPASPTSGGVFDVGVGSEATFVALKPSRHIEAPIAFSLTLNEPGKAIASRPERVLLLALVGKEGDSGQDAGSQTTSIPPTTAELRPVPTLFWCQGTGATSRIVRAALDELDLVTPIVTGLKQPSALAFYEGRLYYADEEAGTLSSCDPEGHDQRLCVSNRFRPRALAVDLLAPALFWSEGVNADAELWHGQFPGFSPLKVEFEGLLTGTGALRWDEECDWLYGSDPLGGRVWRMPRSGSPSALVVQSPGQPRGLAIDTEARWIYWTDLRNDGLFRTRFDGSGTEELIRFDDDYANPMAIAFDPRNNRLLFTVGSDIHSCTRDGKDARVERRGAVNSPANMVPTEPLILDLIVVLLPPKGEPREDDSAQRPAAQLPLSVKDAQRFSSSRSATLEATLDRDGKLTGTFTLENDAILVGFEASANVRLLDESGVLIEVVKIPRASISGKPPGKAVRKQVPFSISVSNAAAIGRVHSLVATFEGGN